MSADEESLKLTLDQTGVVWFGLGDQPPECSDRQVVSFMLLPLIQRAVRVRLPGTSRNAQLIAALYGRKLKSGLQRLEVCSPGVCNGRSSKGPEHCLLAMRRVEGAGSLGGWHEVELADYHAYALISQLTKMRKPDDHALRLLRCHPAWPALSYIPTVSPEWCCYLLADVVDPRWYVDVYRPDRVSKLFSYLGLRTSVFNDLVQTSVGAEVTKSRARFLTVTRAWRGQTPPEDDDGLQPGNFLMRAKSYKGGKRGALRANRLFVSYLFHTWLGQLYAGSNQKESLFVPEHFFKTMVEAEAYKAHVAQAQKDN